MPKTKFDLTLKGYVGGWNFDSSDVDRILEKNPGAEINVLIDSQGGSVATALSISSAFRNHGYVNVHYRGMNASAATIASLGAKHISIESSAMYLVHKCSNLVLKYDLMNADEIEQTIAELEKQKKDLEKIDLNIATMYAAKCKKGKDELLALMAEGGWLNAQEALDWGFVDEIVDDPKGKQASINAKTIIDFESHGIPVPDVPVEETFVERIVAALSGMFEPKKQITNTNIPMKKKFSFIGALLNVEEFDITEGKVDFSDEQMQTVEDRIAELEASIKEKDEQIEALKNAPAETTTTVVTQKTVEDVIEEESYFDHLRTAKEFLDLI